MNLYPERLDVVRTVGSTCEVREVELNLVPAIVETHGHCADERLYACLCLVVRGSESATNVLVIQDLYLEREVFFELE